MTVAVRVFVEPMPEGAWDHDLREESFAQMYSRCRPMLVALCRRLLNGRGDPEAIAQEAFLKAWSALGTFSGARPFWPWVATIARRLCVDELRRLQRDTQRAHLKMEACASASIPDPVEMVIASEEEHAALDALAALPPRERRLIGFRDLDGWSYDQIAQFEGITVEAVRGSLKRARAALRRAYDSASRGVAGLILIGPLRRLRDRAARTAPPEATVASAAAGHVAEAVVTALVVLLGTGMPIHVDTSRTPPVAHGATGMGQTLASAAALDAPAETSLTIEAASVGGLAAAPSAAGDATSPGAPAGAPSFALPTGGADHPDSARIESIAISPAGDGTVFVAGRSEGDCAAVTCAVLFRSDNWGATWRRLPAIDFTGGQLVLPPTFPADPRLFVAGPASFLVSDDGGTRFLQIAPVGGGAAISPTFGRGDDRVFLGNVPRWAYDDRVKAVVPADMAVPSSSLIATFAFSPTFASDGTMYVGGTSASNRPRGPAGPTASAVFRCEKSVCTETVLPEQSVGTPGVATSHSGAIWAWAGQRLYRASGPKASFERVDLGITGIVKTVVASGSHTYLSIVGDAKGVGGGVFVSEDDGVTWSRIGAGTALENGATALAIDRGRVAAAPYFSGGILCAPDGVSFGRCA